MSGLVMQAAMERLMLKHGLSLQTPDIVPLSPPTDHPIVLEDTPAPATSTQRVAHEPQIVPDARTALALAYSRLHITSTKSASSTCSCWQGPARARSRPSYRSHSGPG